jgi:thiol-disulfide isomerase/thioredoxin
MKNINLNKILLLLSIFFVGILITGCANQTSSDTQVTTPTNTDSTSGSNSGSVPASADEVTDSGKKYNGEVLAGDSSPYVVFNQEDYQNALDNDKVILLYFYSEWSDTSKADQKAIYDAFNKMTHSQAIGFRVNYDDDFTDSVEKGLAQTYGVTGSRYKVILKDGKAVQKTSSTSWNENDYVRQIGQYLN